MCSFSREQNYTLEGHSSLKPPSGATQASIHNYGCVQSCTVTLYRWTTQMRGMRYLCSSSLLLSQTTHTLSSSLHETTGTDRRKRAHRPAAAAAEATRGFPVKIIKIKTRSAIFEGGEEQSAASLHLQAQPSTGTSASAPAGPRGPPCTSCPCTPPFSFK